MHERLVGVAVEPVEHRRGDPPALLRLRDRNPVDRDAARHRVVGDQPYPLALGRSTAGSGRPAASPEHHPAVVLTVSPSRGALRSGH